MITFKNLQEIYKPKEIRDFRKEVSNFNKVDARFSSWMWNLPDMMSAYGFKPIGSGKYGSVYANPSYPYIIKIFMKDTAYLRWLSFAKDNQDNPLVPKIKGKVVKISPTFMAVRLEKLKPMTSDIDESKMWAQMDSTPWGQKVGKFLDANASLMDMHQGNIMMRGNQPVIIDPFYNYFRNGNYTIDPDDVSGFKNLLVKI